jgi:hypothetical protein
VIVNGHAEELSVINRGRAAIERDVLVALFDLYGRAPDLPAGIHVNRKAPLAVDDVHDTVVDRRRRQVAEFVHGARVPDRHEARDIRFVDLVKRAVAHAVVAHALGENVICVLAVVIQLISGLAQTRRDPQAKERRTHQKLFHN